MPETKTIEVKGPGGRVVINVEELPLYEEKGYQPVEPPTETPTEE